MEVVSGLMEPTSLQPTTGGSQRDTGWPNITASHSIPPTPAGSSAMRTAGLQRASESQCSRDTESETDLERAGGKESE